MEESDQRWERMNRTMEFLLDSDARLSASLDTLGVRLTTMGDRIDGMADRIDGMGDRMDVMGDRLESTCDQVDRLTAVVERQQALIERIAGAVDSLQLQTRQAVERMLELAEGIAASAVAFGKRAVDHERRIRRLEEPVPPEAV